MKKFFILLLLFSLFQTTHAFDDVVFDSETKTIKELKADIDSIEENKLNIENKLKNFLKDSNLRHMVRDDLTHNELKNFELKISNFTSYKKYQEDFIENSDNEYVIADVKKKIIEEKNKLYKSIIDYIKPESYNQYLAFIKSELTYVSEKDDLETMKLQKSSIINKKVEILEEKIKEHKSYLDQSIKELIEEKLDEKILAIKTNKSFINLANKNKLLLLDKTISKIQSSKDELTSSLEENNIYYEDTIRKKIEVYEIGEQKLLEFKKSL